MWFVFQKQERPRTFDSPTAISSPAKLNGSLLSLVRVNFVLLFPQLERARHGAAKVVVTEPGHMVRGNSNGGSGDGVRCDCRRGVQVTSVCHHLVRSNLWNRVGGCRRIGDGRLLVVGGNLVSNSCRCSSHHLLVCKSRSCHHVSDWRRLSHGVDVAVLIQVLREPLQMERGEPSWGLNKISMDGGEGAQLRALVHNTLKRKAQAKREKRGQDQHANHDWTGTEQPLTPC